MVNIQNITFYLQSCKYYRFPFFDPHNCYRSDGLFSQLQDTLLEIGEQMSKEYGHNFIAINLRGSWLRGIPISGDDIDVLFLVKGLPPDDKERIESYSRCTLLAANEQFQMCEGKVMYGIKVEPVIFLDLCDISMIMNRYMYGLARFLEIKKNKDRDGFQDTFIGSKIAEKKTQFLKSGILIPYVGWIYGRDRRREVFDEIAKFLPIPTKKKALYTRREINEAKDTIHQAFIARNLIFPSLEIKKWVNLKKMNVKTLQKEAMELYRALEPLKDVYARAVINYIYTLTIEEKFLGKVQTRERIEKFASSYDKLVYDILEIAYPPVGEEISPEIEPDIGCKKI